MKNLVPTSPFQYLCVALYNKASVFAVHASRDSLYTAKVQLSNAEMMELNVFMIIGLK